MFEADFRISAQVRSDGQGQRVFRVTEREAPDSDEEFLSRLATLYQQAVYTTLLPGDDLTVAVRLDLPPREVERILHLREDRLFDGESLSGPTADPFPLMRAFYEPFMQRVKPGDVEAQGAPGQAGGGQAQSRCWVAGARPRLLHDDWDAFELLADVFRAVQGSFEEGWST